MKRKNIKDKISDEEWMKYGEDYIPDNLKLVIEKTAKKLGISYSDLLTYLLSMQMSRVIEFEKLNNLLITNMEDEDATNNKN